MQDKTIEVPKPGTSAAQAPGLRTQARVRASFRRIVTRRRPVRR